MDSNSNTYLMGLDAGSSRRPTCALLLFSGGLDSQLTACLLREQGIEVSGIVFQSPFFKPDKALLAAKALNMPLLVKDFTADIIGLLHKPAHGFGVGMNPCIDCHAAMFRRAANIMQMRKYDFIASGEVLNQRPMSQNRQALLTVTGLAGVTDILLRPLSAKLLPLTHPERVGMVNRQLLLDLQGRNRRPQMMLAQKYGLRDYPQPSGGCLLTDKAYAVKLRDLRDHEGLTPENLLAIQRLLIGRHFRIPADDVSARKSYRLVVGRDHDENTYLMNNLLPHEIVIQPLNIPGATGVLAPDADLNAQDCAAAICARYSAAAKLTMSNNHEVSTVTMQLRLAASIEQPVKIIETSPAAAELIERLRIIPI